MTKRTANTKVLQGVGHKSQKRGWQSRFQKHFQCSITIKGKLYKDTAIVGNKIKWQE
jgi:hypothetical protein